ncbi:MAG: tol-pal system protein YbgF [Gammaproteobacteria bacterium]|nr:MAG: tol-pal system protein YbgF [Gammaproteobacteria bacterium]
MLSNLSLNKLFTLPNSDCLLNQRINARLVKRVKIGLCCLGLLFNSFAFALAPVVDAYDDDEDDAPAVTHPANPAMPANETNQASDSSSASRPTSSSPPAPNTPAVPSNSASFSLEQRVTILERQITNLNPMLVQVDDLQQQIQSLQGKIESQQHAIKVLEEQVRNQYLALEKRFAPRMRSSVVSTEKPANVANPSINNTLSPRPIVDMSSKKETSNDRKSMLPNSAPTPAAERAYQAAFQLLKTKQYNEAIEAFETFNKKFPNDLNVANADYFLGQLYLLQGQADSAINFFKRFINRYSQDARVPDAMLQCGLAYFAKGDKAMAMELFEKIIQQYPDSKAAQAAQARLQQFKAMISAASISSKNKV